jgi:hypothetical protein
MNARNLYCDCKLDSKRCDRKRPLTTVRVPRLASIPNATKPRTEFSQARRFKLAVAALFDPLLCTSAHIYKR